MIVVDQAGAGPSNAPDNAAVAPVGEGDAPADHEPTPKERIQMWFSRKITEFGNGWRTFCNFMWNKEKREVMGRGGKSWGKIGLFYLCFYLCLAGFWAAMFAIFYQTISQERPTYNSMITPPGLNLVPFPDNYRIEYGLAAGDEDRERIEREIEQYVFEVLENVDQTSHEDCPDTPGQITDPPTQRFCQYDPSLLGPCAPGAANQSSYATAQPCLYIGLNKVWGWIPESYTMEEVKTKYQKLGVNTSIDFTNRIIFTCYADKIYDDSKYIDFIRVFPADGVSFGHYPYVVGTDTDQQARYIRPVVAVQIGINTRDVDVRLECRALAANIPDEIPGGLFNSREEPSRFRVRIMIRK